MAESAYASSQLYHAAFRNTMNKAILFIDRQRKDWSQLTTKDGGLPTGSGLTPSTLSPSTPSLVSDPTDDDRTSIVSSIIRTMSPPPPYLTPSSMQSSILPSHYLALLTTEFRIPLHLQPSLLKRTRRPISPPPHYSDDLRLVLPREEEGREDLPEYHCSVYKMATMQVKIEQGPRRRSWRRAYIELWGTMLRIYPMAWFGSTVAKAPMVVLSLAGAEATRALDYRKRPFVFRIKSPGGVRCLIQAVNLEDMVSWIEHLQSGINISLDLEERPMPKFLTLQPRRALPDTGILCPRMIEIERRREERRLNQEEILA